MTTEWTDIPEHGEEFEAEFLTAIPQTSMYAAIKNAIQFMEEGGEKLYFVLGRKGVGKTLTLLKILSDLNISYVHHQFKYGKHERIEIGDGNKTIEIYDDFHYLCESVLENKLSTETILSYLKEAVTKDRVIIISENSLSCYYDFGEEYQSIVELIQKPERFIDFIYSWNGLIQSYYECKFNVRFDPVAIAFILNASTNIRFIIRVINYYKGILSAEKLYKSLGVEIPEITQEYYKALSSSLKPRTTEIMDLRLLLDAVHNTTRMIRFFYSKMNYYKRMRSTDFQWEQSQADKNYLEYSDSFNHASKTIFEDIEPLLYESEKMDWKEEWMRRLILHKVELRIEKHLKQEMKIFPTSITYERYRKLAPAIQRLAITFYEKFSDRYLPSKL